MTVQPAEPREWSPVRWAVSIALVFGLQVVAIVWLRDQSRHAPRRPESAPVFRLSGYRSGEMLALEDPTLFALPHLDGFSGKAWIDLPPPPFSEAEGREPELWLTLPVAQLGGAFEEFVRTNPPPPFAAMAAPDPQWVAPRVALNPPESGPSRLRTGGDLAGRLLLHAVGVAELDEYRSPDKHCGAIGGRCARECVVGRVVAAGERLRTGESIRARVGEKRSF